MLQIDRSTDESHDDDGKLKTIYNIRSYRGEAMKLSGEVCGKLIDFEVDSGSCATTIPIPIGIYKTHVCKIPLLPPRTILKSYSGGVLSIGK